MSGPRTGTGGTLDGRRVAGGVVINVAATLVVTVLGFMLTMYLVRHLGASAFGAWVLVSSVLAYSSILDFGIGMTVMRFVAELAHLPDRTEANRLVSTAIVAFTGVGVVVLVAGMVAAPWLASAFGIADSERADFITAFRISTAALALTFPSAVWTAVLQGLQDFTRLNAWIVGQAIVVMAAQIAVVASGGGIVELALVGAAGAVVLLLGKRWTARRHGIRTSPRLAGMDTLRRIAGVSGWVFLMNVSGRLILDTDAVLIGAMLGTAAVAAYQVALGPATAVRRAADQFNSVSLTAAASLKAQDDRRRLPDLLVEATRAVVCVFLPCIALLAAWGDQLLVLWVGPEFASSYATLVVLTVGILAIAVQGTAMQVLLAMERHRVVGLVAALEACCNIALSIILARRMGIVGVALGTLIPTAIVAFGITLPLACRLVGVRALSLLMRLVPPVLVSGGAFVAMLALERLGDFPNLISLALAGAVVVPVTLVACLLADRAGRRTYLPMLQGLRRRARLAHA